MSMPCEKQKIIIALPKGRILQEVMPILEKVGLVPEAAFFDKKCRQLRFETNDPEVDVIRVRSSDVATFTNFGAASMGIVGSDILEEGNYPELYASLGLGIGKCRMSVAASEDVLTEEEPVKWSHIRVATKYPNTTKEYFSKKGIQAECIKLNGAMELAPNLGLCGRIVDLVSTGSTLKANGLVEIDRIKDVSSYLVTNRTALKTQTDKLNDILKKFSEAVK
jgi:ATP phosphoribosyltransferase